MLLIKDLDSGDNMNGIDSASTRVGKDCDENMFFDIEGARVEGEFEAGAFEENAACDFGSHESTEWDHGYLCGDGGNGEGLGSVPEELVEEG